jgi:TPR repeat protein
VRGGRAAARIALLALVAVAAAAAAARPARAGGFGGSGELGEGPPPEPRRPPGPEPKIPPSPFEELEVRCVEEHDGAAWHGGRDGTQPSMQQAESLFLAGCSFGHTGACMAVGRMYLQIEAGMMLLLPDGQVSLDLGSALAAFRRACELGEKRGCGYWGDIALEPRMMLPRPEATFRGTEQDEIQAVQAYALGCAESSEEADARSCARLAELHEAGRAGLRRNPARSAALLERACVQGHDTASCERAQALRAEMAAGAGAGGEAGTAAAGGGAGTAAGAGAGAAVEAQVGAQPGPGPRRSVQPRRPRPDVQRFEDPSIGIVGSKPPSPLRVEFEAGIGARWTYGYGSFGGLKLRVGVNLWAFLFGIGLDTAFTTDAFFQEEIRTYARYLHSLSGKFAIPLTDRLPIPARMVLVVGGGAALGSLRLDQGGFVTTWGARELLELVLCTNQESGPRQWGAVRVEEQQSFWAARGGVPEHSTQVMVVVGFTAGGWGPRWTNRPRETERAGR